MIVFTPLSSPSPKEDSACLSLKAPSGPGLSEHNLIVLVVESEKQTKEVSQSEKLLEHSDDTDVHYSKSRWHLAPKTVHSSGLQYTIVFSYQRETAKKRWKTSFDKSDISLGHINTLFTMPPHTTGSLKAHITKVEGLAMPGHALYKDMESFEDTDSGAAMNDTDVISFQGDSYPGSDEGNPVALVNATTDTAADQKAKPIPGNVLSEYPLDTAATNHALSDGPDSNFTKRAQAKYDNSEKQFLR